MTKKIIATILLLSILLCGSVSFAAPIRLADINESHWAYEAITKLIADGTVNGFPDGTFRPEATVTYAEFYKMITGVWEPEPTVINREKALEMLWEHNNTPMGYTVPAVISEQMTNKNAVAWGYATGLMQGSDGLNLRPGDTLTRAEAAALIVRASNPAEKIYTFAESVSDTALKLIWDSYGIFESEYVADETVSADDILNAIVKLGNIRKSSIKVTDNSAYDASFLLIYSSLLQAKITIPETDKTNVSDKYGKFPQSFVAYALNNGVIIENKNTPATKRDVATTLIQIDNFVGRGGFKVNTNTAEFPVNSADYPLIIKDVPTDVYLTPFDNGAKPVDYYSFVIDFTSIFETFVKEMQSKYGKKSAEFTLIPSLVSQNQKTEAILRIKCKLTGSATAYELFGAGYENAGNEFYMDLHTGEPVLNIYIPTDIAKIGKFVCNK